MTEGRPTSREHAGSAVVAGGRARILITGDLYPGRRPEAALSAGDAHAVWGALDHLFESHDLCIAGLEAPLTDRRRPIAKSGPSMRSAPECADGISRSFQMVNLANNHIMDMGAGGLRDTMEACRAAGLRTVGAGEDLERAQASVTVAAGGLDVAVIAAADHEFSIAGPHAPGAAPIDAGEILGGVADHSRRGSQVLVLLHAGNEHYPLPSPRLQRLCRQVIDAGAACVVCSHSHVAGSIEHWEGRPIVYGTGNFLFDPPAPRGLAWNIGQLVSLTLDGCDGPRLEAIPYEQCLHAPVVKPLSGDLLAEYHRRSRFLNRVVADPAVLEAEWRAFAARSRRHYVSTLLQLTKVERGLLRLGVWPRWRVSRGDLPALRNLFTCEAHREAVAQVLDGEIGAELLDSASAGFRD